MSKLDPEIIKVLLAAGIIPEVATDQDVIRADTFLMRANGNVRLAASYLRVAKEGEK